MSAIMFLSLFNAYQTLNLPFNILNEGKTLYGTSSDIVEHYLDFHRTMDLIEIMERNNRINQSLNRAGVLN